MDNLNLVSTFAEFKELKNIDKSTMIGVLEDVFRHLLIKTYETDENFDVIINPEKGDLEIWRNRTIVEDGTVENPNQQISLTDARKIDSTYEVGEEVAEEIKLADFGRRAVLSLRQNLASRIMDLEKANLFNKYTEKVGEIITGEVYQVWKKEILVLDDEDAFDGDVTTLPETTCAAVCFRGSHPEAPAQYARLMDYLRAHALAPADFSREITMIDYGLTSDPEKFVTEIRIPVTET